jgi:hypothetical protein
MKLKFNFELRSIEDLIFFLINSTEREMRIPSLVERCKRIGMIQIDYINFQEDPMFENGHSFLIGCDTDDQVRVEIIEVNGKILQAGFQIIFNPHFLSLRFKKYMSISQKFLLDLYKKEFPQDVQGTIVLNYANNISQSFLNKFKVDKNWVLNFKVMNKLNWENVNFNSAILNN